MAKKEKVLTAEQIKRKNVLSHRLLLLLGIIDALLVIYLVIQFIILFTK